MYRNIAKKCGINAKKVPENSKDTKVILKRCKKDVEELRKMCRNNANRYRTNAEEMQKSCRNGEEIRRDAKKMQN